MKQTCVYRQPRTGWHLKINNVVCSINVGVTYYLFGVTDLGEVDDTRVFVSLEESIFHQPSTSMVCVSGWW